MRFNISSIRPNMRIVVLACLTHFAGWCHLAWLPRNGCFPIPCAFRSSCLLECRAEIVHWVPIYYCKSHLLQMCHLTPSRFNDIIHKRRVFLPFTLPALSSWAFKHRPPLIPATWFHLDLWHRAISEFPLLLIYLCVFCRASNRTSRISIVLFQPKSLRMALIVSCMCAKCL